MSRLGRILDDDMKMHLQKMWLCHRYCLCGPVPGAEGRGGVLNTVIIIF